MSIKSDASVKQADLVIEMIQTELESNYFNMDDKHYIHIEGVEIGSRSFAYCYMRKWNGQLFVVHRTPAFYKFIDDDRTM